MRLSLHSGRRKISRVSGLILTITGAGTALGLASFAAWQATGNTRWLTLFFQGPGLALTIGLAVAEVWLIHAVRRQFLRDEPLFAAWTWIGLSAVCDLLGALCVQWLTSPSPANPLNYFSGWTAEAARELHQFGLIAGGTFRYGLLSVGLLAVLRVYRNAGFPGRLKLADWILIGAVLGYVVSEVFELAVAIHRGKTPSLPEVLGWPVDPLLCVLLCQSRLLARSIERMGKGSIGLCWRAFTVAILLVWTGDLSIWATAFGHLSWEWTSIGWYVWLPAAGAFAAAPAYQLEAIDQAMNARHAGQGALA